MTSTDDSSAVRERPAGRNAGPQPEVLELHIGDVRQLFSSMVIGAWVALWRPLEIFLYDWWPIREEIRLYRRLSCMNVELLDVGIAGAGAVP